MSNITPANPTLHQDISFHGVLLSIYEKGVFLRGPSGIGKSELALAMIDRGHALVVDDAPLFERSGKQSIHGRCPRMLHNFLQIRDLGILDIQALYGKQATRTSVSLNLIIALSTNPVQNYKTPLFEPFQTESILGVQIPKITIHMESGRNIPLLIETAVRTLRLPGSKRKAARSLLSRHRRALLQESHP